MKKYLIFTHLFLIVLIASCRKDLGNYDYEEFNELQINNVEQEYLALSGQPFKVSPELTFAKGKEFREEDYTYKWTASNMLNVSTPQKILSEERALDKDLALVPSKYRIYYRVTEKATGVFWQRDFTVVVTSQLAGGWLVLNELKDKGRLDMLNYSLKDNKFSLYRDVLHTFGDLTLQGKPSFVSFTKNRDIFDGTASDRVYLGTDQQTYSFNVQLYTWNNYRNIKKEVMRPTAADYRAVKVFRTDVTGENYILDNEDALSVELYTTNMLYGNILNRLTTGPMIKISPQIMQNYRDPSAYLVMYDIEKRRFMTHRGSNGYSTIPVSNKPELFDPSDMKKDLLYIDAAASGQYQFTTLLKEPQGSNHYLLRFTAWANMFTLLDYELIPASQELAKANLYAVDPTFGYLIYAVGSKVYSYNPFNKTHALLKDLGSRHISLMKYQHISRFITKDARLISYGKSLMICSYDPDAVEGSGKMEFFDLSLDNKLTAKEMYEGFDKIVDVSYRE